jgi:hypothetical protein
MVSNTGIWVEYSGSIHRHLQSDLLWQNNNIMKIVVLTGSPRKKGNSAYLAEHFIKGAQEAGHEIFSYDCAKHKVAGCLACNHCGMDGPCIQKDDFEIVRPHIINADAGIIFYTKSQITS